MPDGPKDKPGFMGWMMAEVSAGCLFDKGLLFASLAQFTSHFKRCSHEEAQSLTSKTYNEMAKPINNYEKVKCYNQGISEVEKGLVYICISLSSI